MAEKPLLIFPQATSAGRYKQQRPIPNKLIAPTKDSQVRRLGTRIDALEAALSNRRLRVEEEASGFEPEMVLVFETRGPIADFFKAVAKIPELEWLGEYEEEFDQDDIFSLRGTSADAQIRGRLFFVMSNYEAINQLKRLWHKYKYGERFVSGTTKWRDLFALLYDVRQWNVTDRIYETGIEQDWRERLEANEETIPFEVELWYRKKTELRAAVERRVSAMVEMFDGEIITSSIINEIGYHAILVKGPIGIFRELTENSDIELFRSNDVMYIRPTGQTSVPLSDEQPQEEESEREKDLPTLAPVVALLDGLPLQNHVKLAGRIIVDDPDDYEENYPANKRLHGTAMASLIVNGDLNSDNAPLRSLLYVRPIMRYENALGREVEMIPENFLTVDLIFRAVKRLYDEGMLANIKIINLSIGDPCQVFDNKMSSWAKLVDWLSFQYDILFVISTGNCLLDIDLGLTREEYRQLLATPDRLNESVLTHIYRNARHRKILSPAESINALTVGASHDDLAVGYSIHRNVEVFTGLSMFSPITRIGHGYRRSIKPDLVMPGGRVLFRDPEVYNVFRISNYPMPPGIKVASPAAGGINGISFTRGTSNSAALLSREAAKLYEMLIDENLISQIPNEYLAVILKSLLVHSASWNRDSKDFVDRTLDSFGHHHKVSKSINSRFFGYGKADTSRVLECTSKRVTIIGYGALAAEGAHVYRFPLPPSISGVVEWKRLIISLAWLTPVNYENQLYRKAKLWFDILNKEQEEYLGASREFYDSDAVNRGTVQHEIFYGNRATAFVDGSYLSIRVNCKSDGGSITDSIKYGLSVTLEVSDAINVDIYNEVSVRIQPQVRV